MVLGQKLEVLSLLVFLQNRPKQNVFCLRENRLAILHYKNIDLKKWKILHFFKGVSLWFFFAKTLETLPFFFFSTIGRKKVSSDLVDRKLVILYYENIDLKQVQNFAFFQGGYTMVFGQKLEILSSILF